MQHLPVTFKGLPAIHLFSLLPVTVTQLNVSPACHSRERTGPAVAAGKTRRDGRAEADQHFRSLMAAAVAGGGARSCDSPTAVFTPRHLGTDEIIHAWE